MAVFLSWVSSCQKNLWNFQIKLICGTLRPGPIHDYPGLPPSSNILCFRIPQTEAEIGRYSWVRHHVPCFLAKYKNGNRQGELLDAIPDLNLYRSKETSELFTSKSLQNWVLACFLLWSLWVLEKGNKWSDIFWLIRIPHYHSVWEKCMKSLALNDDKCVHSSTLFFCF